MKIGELSFVRRLLALYLIGDPHLVFPCHLQKSDSSRFSMGRDLRLTCWLTIGLWLAADDSRYLVYYSPDKLHKTRNRLFVEPARNVHLNRNSFKANDGTGVPCKNCPRTGTIGVSVREDELVGGRGRHARVFWGEDLSNGRLAQVHKVCVNASSV